jgi:hypothetical protein
LGRVKPCTLVKKKSQNGEDALLLSTVRFPFPLGKGLGVRFLASFAMPALHFHVLREL